MRKFSRKFSQEALSAHERIRYSSECRFLIDNRTTDEYPDKPRQRRGLAGKKLGEGQTSATQWLTPRNMVGHGNVGAQSHGSC